MNEAQRPALFLDRDGIVNVDHSYVFRPQDLELVEGLAALVKLAKQLGFFVIVITNQSGVARGYFSLDDVKRFHSAIDEALLASVGVCIDNYYICPHYPEGTVKAFSFDCNCRKPKTGLIEQACKDYPIDLGSSLLLGDKASDVACGLAMNLPSFQLDTGKYKIHPDASRLVYSLSEIQEILAT